MKRDTEYLRWRDKVLARDGGCVVCYEKDRKIKNCNVHHLIPKNFKKYALDVDNGLSLCPSHHTLGKYSAHKHPMWFSRYMRIHHNLIYQQIIVRIRELEDEEKN